MAVQRPFAVFDIDGTIFRSSLLIEITRECVRKGLFPQEAIAEVDEAHKRWQDRTSPDAYEQYLMAVVVAFMNHIKGVTEKQFEIVSEAVIERTHRHTYVYTRDLIETLRPTHALLAISGSPAPLVQQFAKRYGFEDFAASVYAAVDGIYTGEAVKAHSHKDTILKRLAKENNLSFKDSWAVGDSGGDIELLESVEQPIAFNPDRELRETALERGWKVVLERKSQIYELEKQDNGYFLAQTR